MFELLNLQVFFLISSVLQRLSRDLLMFVCVFYKNFLTLASHILAVGEYEYRLLDPFSWKICPYCCITHF